MTYNLCNIFTTHTLCRKQNQDIFIVSVHKTSLTRHSLLKCPYQTRIDGGHAFVDWCVNYTSYYDCWYFLVFNLYSTMFTSLHPPPSSHHTHTRLYILFIYNYTIPIILFTFEICVFTQITYEEN